MATRRPVIESLLAVWVSAGLVACATRATPSAATAPTRPDPEVLLATLEGAQVAPGAAPSAISESTYHDALNAAYREWKDLKEGQNADHIPALAKADPKLYGIALVTVQGAVYELGNARDEFSMQALSSPLTLARTIDAVGVERVRSRIGSNANDQPFRSMLPIAANQSQKGPGNPFVTAGALAAIDLLPARSADEKFEGILGILSAFAARKLAVDQQILRSASQASTQDRSIATLLKNHQVLQGDPAEALRLHTQQSSVRVSALDLAVMGATLANNGRSPISRYQVVSPEAAREVLAVMGRSGMNQLSGDWMAATGMAAMSGASGGIMAVLPGHFAVGTFSPPLDREGSSVRGQKAIASLVKGLGRDLRAVGMGGGTRTAEPAVGAGATGAQRP